MKTPSAFVVVLPSRCSLFVNTWLDSVIMHSSNCCSPQCSCRIWFPLMEIISVFVFFIFSHSPWRQGPRILFRNFLWQWWRPSFWRVFPLLNEDLGLGWELLLLLLLLLRYVRPGSTLSPAALISLFWPHSFIQAARNMSRFFFFFSPQESSQSPEPSVCPAWSV